MTATAEPATTGPRGDIWIAIGLAVIAALVAAGVTAESNAHDVFRYPLIDAATYYRQAGLIATGQSPTGTLPYWQPPLYPHALAAAMKLGITTHGALRLLQAALLCGGLAAMTFLLARKALPRAYAAAAALALSVYGPMVFFAGQLLPAAGAALLLMAATLATLRTACTRRIATAVACGVLFGLGALTVANSIVVLLLAVAWLWHGLKSDPRRAAVVGATVLGAALTIAPVTLRNAVVSGRFVPISTNAGINLFVGNGPGPDDLQTVRPGIDWNRLVARPFASGEAEDEAEASLYFVRMTLAEVLHHPAHAVANQARKALRLVNAREIPRNVDLYAFAAHSWPLRCMAWRAGPIAFPFGIVGPLALAGVAIALFRRGPIRFVALATLLYAASIVAFFPSSRYTVPVLPWVVILAALGAGELARALRTKDWKLPAGVCCAAIIVNLPVAFPTDRVRFDAELLTYTGIAAQTRGDVESAVRLYERSLELDPESADTWFHLGTAQRSSGDTEAAIASHRTALEARPDHHRAIQDLAVLVHGRGETSEAVSLLRECLQLDPENRKAMRNLAIGLIEQGHYEEANAWLDRCGEQPLTTAQVQRLEAKQPSTD